MSNNYLQIERDLNPPAVDPVIEQTAQESDNENGSEEYSGFFEGPEKTMEVRFRVEVGVDDGLRALSRPQIDQLCTLAKCSILSKISNSHFDSYVLSESSLFVYKYKYIMKTCGTTTLLRCLNQLLSFADELKMEVESVMYSRKNLICPTAQLWPHSSFGDEIKYINTHAKLQERLHGNGYILGPVTGDHWFVYCADLHPPSQKPERSLRACNSSNSLSSAYSSSNSLASLSGMSQSGKAKVDVTVNLMMFDLAPEVCRIFFKSNTASGPEMTAQSGIGSLCAGARIDETAFTPCGYSMNAMLHEAYYTCHITPEEACSYASFETNVSMTSYAALVRNCLAVFRPKRFVLTLLGEAGSSGVSALSELPTDMRRVELSDKAYQRTSLSSTKMDSDASCVMAAFCLEQHAPLSTRAESINNFRDVEENSSESARPRANSVN